MPGIIVDQDLKEWGVARYWNQSKITSADGGNDLILVRGCKSSFDRIEIISFVDGDFIVHEVKKTLNPLDNKAGLSSKVFWTPDIRMLDEVIKISHVNATWGTADIFDYQESFRKV